LSKSGIKARTAVLFDPYPLWLDLVEGVLAEVDVTVVGKATRPQETLPLLAKRNPDLLVVEIETKDSRLDGIAWIRIARESNQHLKLVVFSSNDDLRLIESTLAAGASAYLVKTADRHDLAAAVRQAFEPSMYLPDPPTRPIRTRAAGANRSANTNGSADGATELTRREWQILRLVVQGYTNAQLAQMLWVTEQTVKFHLSNVYRKLGVSNRTEASRWAQVHDRLSVRPKAFVPREAGQKRSSIAGSAATLEGDTAL
jgi:DNA-binding NarL/FixJ family response regulator